MKKRILIVDDDRYEMQAYADKLQAEGYEVVYMSSAEEALTFLQGRPVIHLIIVDLIMRYSPGEEREDAHYAGYNFCKRIRDELSVACPIIVLTVVTDEQMLSPVRPLASIVLHKPVLPVELLAHVKECLP